MNFLSVFFTAKRCYPQKDMRDITTILIKLMYFTEYQIASRYYFVAVMLFLCRFLGIHFHTDFVHITKGNEKGENDMELEKFVKELEMASWTEAADNQYEPHFIKDLGTAANSYGFRSKDFADAILANKTASKNFTVLVSACAISMGYTYLCDDKRGSHWDERNLASKEYFAEHLEALKKVFAEAFGSEMPFREEPEYQYFSNDCRLKRYSPLMQELMDFEREHHTIQQRMARLFVIVLGTIASESGIDVDQRFPFI